MYMFGIDILQYLVFAIIAIPPFFIGYYKGWRSALFTLIITMITGGILVGISIAIYDGTLWPLFKDLFLKNHNPGGLDVDSLKNISKLSVISISVGIGLIPGTLFIFGIYFAFKKLINKYMRPRISKVSNNEVKISRKNLKASRMGGVAINGVVGLVVASAATGAIATLTTPVGSSTFTKVTNSIGDVMTFGQAQYDEDYQKMFNFIDDGKHYKNQIDRFRALLKPKQDATGKFIATQGTYDIFTQKSDEHTDFIKVTNDMARDSEEISEAFVLMFLENSKSNGTTKLIGFDPKNPIGSSKTNILDNSKADVQDKTIEDSINSLETFLNDSTHEIGIHWNASGVKKAVKEFFEKSSVSFEKSPYYMNWSNQKDLLAKKEVELAKKIKESKDLTISISNDRKTNEAYVKTINDNAEAIRKAWDSIQQPWKRIGTGSPLNIPTPISFTQWTDQVQIKDNNNVMQLPIDTIKDKLPLSVLSTQSSDGEYSQMMNAKSIRDKDLAQKNADKSKYDLAISATRSAKLTFDNDLREIKNKMEDQKNNIAKIKELENSINVGLPLQIKTMNQKLNESVARKNKLSPLGNAASNEELDKRNSLIRTYDNEVKEYQKQIAELNEKLKKANEQLVVLNAEKQAIDDDITSLDIKKGTDGGTLAAASNEENRAKQIYDSSNRKYIKSNAEYTSKNNKYELDKKMVQDNVKLISNNKNHIMKTIELRKLIETKINTEVGRKFILDDKTVNQNNKESIVWQKDENVKIKDLLVKLEIKRNEMSKIYLQRENKLIDIYSNALI